MIRECVSVSYGEIALKKDNKPFFERELRKNLKATLADLNPDFKFDQSKVFIYSDDNAETVRRLQKIFGISYIAPQFETESTLDKIFEAAIHAVKFELKRAPFKTFKIESKRVDKSFPIKSPEISRLVGGAVLKENLGLTVDVKNPDRIIRVDVRKTSFVSPGRIKALGGMPVGSNGRVLSLLSGGIDSPVASILAMKRGLQVDYIHFHSYPFTSKRSFLKTKELAELCTEYEPYGMLFSFNLFPIQEAITKNCDIRFTTLLQRRSMTRLATLMAKDNDRTALVTGENLGQVASQTLPGMSVVDPVTDLIILRPLITYDKTEIIDLARKFGTYEKSIEPFEDCCTVFVAKHPKTNPTLEQVLEEESKINYLEIEEEIFNKRESYKIK